MAYVYETNGIPGANHSVANVKNDNEVWDGNVEIKGPEALAAYYAIPLEEGEYTGAVATTSQVAWGDNSDNTRHLDLVLPEPVPAGGRDVNVKAAIMELDADDPRLFVLRAYALNGTTVVAEANEIAVDEPNMGTYQLNIEEITIEDVPEGATTIRVEVYSPSGKSYTYTDKNGDTKTCSGSPPGGNCGDSVTFVGAAAAYSCEAGGNAQVGGDTSGDSGDSGTSTPTEVIMDGPNGNYIVSVEYSESTRTWTYTVSEDDDVQDLSHWLIGLNKACLTSSNVTLNEGGAVDKDGQTGIYGAKWDTGTNQVTTAGTEFTVTIADGVDVTNGTVTLVTKGAQTETIGTIDGPVCSTQ
jgi:hypothetical protein